MFIKLTNASRDFQGDPIILNSNSVVSVFRSTIEDADSDPRTVTFVHCPPHGNWQVSETVDEIADLLIKSS